MARTQLRGNAVRDGSIGLADLTPEVAAKLCDQISVSVDFGSIPVHACRFTINDSGALVAGRVTLIPAPASDEAEMDALMCSAACFSDGVITCYVHAVPGPVSGIHNFNYFLG